MNRTASTAAALRLPTAPDRIERGVPLKSLLDTEAIDALAHNLATVHPAFPADAFQRAAMDGLAALGLLDRAQHLATVLHATLPQPYAAAIDVLLASLTPPLTRTDGLGLAGFFYLPHGAFVARYGLDPAFNNGVDPFDVSMRAQYELTRRFSAEFSMRSFLIADPARTLARLLEWTRDGDPHVRRLCSEGTRPRLPWGRRIAAFVADPDPLLPILVALKDDPELYVRRSVANSLGDIAKDHPGWAFAVCRRWLDGASRERRALIRHAVRHPARRGDGEALALRAAAR